MFGIPVIWIAVGSVAFFIVGLIGAVAGIVWLPTDYFINDDKKYFWDHHPVSRFVALILRNVLGVAVIIAGVIMSLPGVPGQGFLTILLGLLLLTFPGKKRLVRSIVARPAVTQCINSFRARFKRPPLQMELAVVEQPGEVEETVKR